MLMGFLIDKNSSQYLLILKDVFVGLVNLKVCVCDLCQALVQSCSEESLANDPNIRMIALFDNEEVRGFFLFTSHI